MAVVQNPITGRSKQKYASAIFSTWKGINVLRSLPLSVANPKTPKQLLQRAKLRIMVALYRLMPGVIAVGYRQQAVKKSEYNAFGSDMLLNAFAGSTVETLSVNLPDILIAKGTMASTPIASISSDDPDVIVTWDEAAPLAPGQSTTDLAYAVMIGKPTEGNQPVVLGVADPVARSAGTITIPDFDSTGMQSYFAYLFFASIVGSQVSDSVNDELA